jgi:hypothetical protein
MIVKYIAVFVTPAAIVVALKSIQSMAKDWKIKKLTAKG